MRIAIGADHGGFALKEHLKAFLLGEGHDVLDVGSKKLNPLDDYTDFSHAVASAMRDLHCHRGIIACTTGAGTCVVANKYPGIRAVECACIDDVRQGREHLGMNVMTMGSIKVTPAIAKDMAEAFLSTRPRSGRHHRRRQKIERSAEACILV